MTQDELLAGQALAVLERHGYIKRNPPKVEIEVDGRGKFLQLSAHDDDNPRYHQEQINFSERIQSGKIQRIVERVNYHVLTEHRHIRNSAETVKPIHCREIEFVEPLHEREDQINHGQRQEKRIRVAGEKERALRRVCVHEIRQLCRQVN